MFNVLNKIEQQSKIFTLYKYDLNNCLTIIFLCKQKQSYCNTIASAIDIIYVRDCKAYYLIQLKKELKILEQAIKQLQAKIVKNSIFLLQAQATFATTIEIVVACN